MIVTCKLLFFAVDAFQLCDARLCLSAKGGVEAVIYSLLSYAPSCIKYLGWCLFEVITEMWFFFSFSTQQWWLFEVYRFLEFGFSVWVIVGVICEWYGNSSEGGKVFGTSCGLRLLKCKVKLHNLRVGCQTWYGTFKIHDRKLEKLIFITLTKCS